MSLQQPNSTAVWTEQKVGGAISIAGLIDNGTHYSIGDTTEPDARLLDKGNNAYQTDEDETNPNDYPELGLLNVGDAAVITYE